MYEKPLDHMYGQKIEIFNSAYSINALLIGVDFIADNNSSEFEYLGNILQSRYYHPNGLTISIKFDNLIGIIEIHTFDGFLLDHAFDIYAHFYHGGDVNKALNWESDLRINMAKLQAQSKPQPQIKLQPFQNQQYQGYSCQPSPYLPPPVQNYISYPTPNIDMDVLLDNSSPKQYLKLEDCYHDKDSLALKLPQYISHKTDISNGTNIILTLSVFSGMTSKRYQCAYKDGRTVAIGLYAALEQSSGSAKSLALGMLIEPLTKMIEPTISQIKAAIEDQEKQLDKLDESLAGCTTREDRAYNKKQIAETKNLIKKLKKNFDRLQNMMPISNVTSAALDAMLTTTDGFFFAATSEQGFVNSILGLRQNPKFNNNDLLLNGREGGYVNSNRVGSKSYSGRVCGAIVIFAQEGVIGSLLEASGNTGLAERSIMISEPSPIGYRNRITDKINGDHILEQYAKRCEFFKIYVDDENALCHDSLITLKISGDGWRHIAHFEQELEYKMRSGEELSHPILQRVVGKTKMQIMGIASNLFLLHTDNPPESELDDPFIPNEFVVMAINIFNELITGVRNYCERKGLISDVAQLAAVFNVFVGKGENGAYTVQELKKRLQQIKPFKDMEEPRKAIQQALDFLVLHHVLLIGFDGKYFKNPVQFNPNCR
ncbi:DUF3987 domain-containing protein [Methylicorpusculum oleiharenae]|uniref:DUF3987 domain-containing protein n=1 Tax=Methylicorpusculum oleiharenae TaxID=1338687 RepID=UPI0013591509|nr:DUF3987 domain-containing protein [Methylicorpusculum oleiharenae]MCD2451106.1 DUF3987 domain-containing protein [Methylicorpusculum oleiharenae]